MYPKYKKRNSTTRRTSQHAWALCTKGRRPDRPKLWSVHAPAPTTSSDCNPTRAARHARIRSVRPKIYTSTSTAISSATSNTTSSASTSSMGSVRVRTAHDIDKPRVPRNRPSPYGSHRVHFGRKRPSYRASLHLGGKRPSYRASRSSPRVFFFRRLRMCCFTITSSSVGVSASTSTKSRPGIGHASKNRRT